MLLLWSKYDGCDVSSLKNTKENRLVKCVCVRKMKEGKEGLSMAIGRRESML